MNGRRPMSNAAARTAGSSLLLAALTLLGGAGPAAAQTAADSAWDAGDTDRARQLYTERLAADSSDTVALHRLALILAWDEDYGRSLALFDRLIEIAPADIGARIHRARVVAWTGDYDRALTLLDRTAERAPDDPAVEHERARVLGWAGRLDQARGVYRALLDRNPDDVQALVGLARVLRWQGRYADARAAIGRALELEPGSTAARDESRRLRARLGPRLAPGFAYEWDSDGNDIYTAFGHAAWHPIPALELRVDVYRRGASLDPVVPETRWTTGGAFTTAVELSGWTLAGSAGGGAPDPDDVDPTATYRLVVASPARHPLAGTLTVGRELFDATALTLASRVIYDRVRLDLGADAGRWRVEGHASSAWFESLESSTGNRRLAGSLRATRPAADWLEVGARARAFGFDRELSQGYFDPDLYILMEAPVTASTTPDASVIARLSLAPGVQKIRTDGDPTAAFNATGTVEWRQGPGRTASLELFYAVNGTGPLAQDAEDYRYFAVNVQARWVF